MRWHGAALYNHPVVMNRSSHFGIQEHAMPNQKRRRRSPLYPPNSAAALHKADTVATISCRKAGSRRLMALMVLLFGLSVLARAVCAAGTGLDLPLLLTQVPAEAKRAATNWNPHSLVRTDWFEGARVVVVSPDGQVKVLSEGFQSACDPSLSFDAKKFVFAAKKTAASSWRVYEVGVDGSGLRAVSAETQEARGPVYASVLFTLDSPEPWFTVEFSAREATLNEAGLPSAASLYNLSLDGKELRRVTYTPNNSFDPCQTSDGRIIFAMERYPTQPGASGGRVSLYSINMEGTDLEPYGAEQGNRVQQMPCPTDAGRVVFVESDAGSWDGAGQLACVQERRPHQSYRSPCRGGNAPQCICWKVALQPRWHRPCIQRHDTLRTCS